MNNEEASINARRKLEAELPGDSERAELHSACEKGRKEESSKSWEAALHCLIPSSIHLLILHQGSKLQFGE